ncbi:MAG: SurA N-terminal domain-containing protein [Novosphingobium sp.]
MLGFFRSFFKSKVGIAVTLGFLALIAIAFASADITGSSFGGVAGGDRVATVGKQKIATGELSQAVSGAFERARQQNPGLTMPRFVASGAVTQILDDMIDRSAVFEFGRRHGITASDRLVDSEIVKIPAFHGPDGKFSQEIYNQTLRQQGLTDAAVRNDLAQGLVAKQVLVPVAFGAHVPQALAERYASMRQERRRGEILLVPSAQFAPKTPPSAQALSAYYTANRANYTRPERRVIRYAEFGEEALKAVPAPSEAEIAKAYADNRQAYAASESRTVTQVILPTQAAAGALAAEVAKGTALDAAAKAKGLLPTTATVIREALAAQSSAAVADAVFGTARGAIATPARSGLGWHVFRVDAVVAKPGKTLDQARAEIVPQLTEKKRRTALSDLSAKIEDEFDGGASLNDVAKEMGLTVSSTPPLMANGQIFGEAKPAPAELARVIPTAFQIERENESQLAEVEPGKRFVLFDVGQITPAAPAPLTEIRARVAQDWALAQGSAAAKAAADKLIAALKQGKSLGEAGKIAGVPLAGQPIDVTRDQLLARSGGRVPPPLALMFGMAKGTAKRLEAPAKQGWFVVRLADVIPGAILKNDPQLPAMQRELGMLAGREYADQFRRALRQEIGAERNAAALRSVTRQLTGGQ